MSDWNEAIFAARCALSDFYDAVRPARKGEDAKSVWPPATEEQLKAIGMCIGVVATLARPE